MTLKDDVLLGFRIINQKIKQKAVGIELKTLKDAREFHFDASQRSSKRPAWSQEQTTPTRYAKVQGLPQVFMEHLSLDQSIHLQDGEWAHLFASTTVCDGIFSYISTK